MTESVVAMLELLHEPTEGDEIGLAHLMGQVAAEVVTSSPSTQDLRKLAVQIQSLQLETADEDPSLQEFRLLRALLIGFFQTLQVECSTDNSGSSQGTVMERILFALAEQQMGPTDLGKRIGSATAVVSRKLRDMREQKLVERASSDDPADGRYHLHKLTLDGEAFIDRRFMGDASTLLGSPASIGTSQQFDYGVELRKLVDLTRHLRKNDPLSAAKLAPTLEYFKEKVDNHSLRAEATGELCVLARSVKDLYGRDDLQRWYNELLDMADIDTAISARAYYERGRWRMMYEAPSGNIGGALRDFDRARKVAQKIETDEKFYRLGWITYQEALIYLQQDLESKNTKRIDEPQENITSINKDEAIEKSLEAKKLFDSITNEHFNPLQGAISCEILLARAYKAKGQDALAKNTLKAVVALAESAGFRRQEADARLRLGQLEAELGDDAERNLTDAGRFYKETGNADLAVMAEAAKDSIRYLKSKRTQESTSLLSGQLCSFSRELGVGDHGTYPPAYYFRLAGLWREVALISTQLKRSENEVEDAFRNSVSNYVSSANMNELTDTLVYWWRFRDPERLSSPQELEHLIAESGIDGVSEHTINSAIDRLINSHSSGTGKITGEEAANSLWRTLLS